MSQHSIVVHIQMQGNLFVELVELEGITVLSKELNADPLVVYL